MKSKSSSELEQIPGVGKSIAQDLRNLGIHAIQDLKAKAPEKLYQNLCVQQGKQVDQYVFRCAVYYASTKEREPELLKWWNWKNRKLEV